MAQADSLNVAGSSHLPPVNPSGAKRPPVKLNPNALQNALANPETAEHAKAMAARCQDTALPVCKKLGVLVDSLKAHGK